MEKQNLSTRAKWRSSLSACRGVQKKGLTAPALLETHVVINHRVVPSNGHLPVIAHNQYRVAFDLYQKGFEWWFPATGLPFVILGGLTVWFGRRRNRRDYRLFGYVIVGFACFWSGVALSSMFREYLALHSAYRNSHFSVVEGRVTDFRPMPYQGHSLECFSVQAQTFCYSDYAVTAGFNNSASHGGPIREGLPVRVSYVGKTIIRLEVRSDELSSGAQKTD